MIKKINRRVLIVILVVFIVSPLAIVLPIVFKQSNDVEISNTTTVSNSNTTMITTSTAQLKTTSRDMSIGPQTTILTLTEETFSSWTTNGTVFANDGTLDPLHSEVWHVCGNGSSASITRSVILSERQSSYFNENATVLEIAGLKKGKIIADKFPRCVNQNLPVSSMDEQDDNNTVSWARFAEYRTLCSNYFQIEIIFRDGLACIKNLKVTLWKKPWY